ncbi:hypothetical protein [Campylobacter sp. US33a]|uniref:hypothetical protein n=1 Tax=Campylobacter sp. US33a TaxID=2498120 RepID=UPI001067DF12|nr:hypothetical protein [Campylobacter sp. US33a]TEY01539.1 hypothetical protein ELQ16_07150 [Campylobacter sp. US33a]
MNRVINFYDGTKLYFNEQFKDYYLIALHTWNDYDVDRVYCNLEIYNAGVVIEKECGFRNFVFSFFNKIKIDDKTMLSLSKNQHAKIKEYCRGVSSDEKAMKLSECNLIAFFLASSYGLSSTQNFSFEKFVNEEFIISKEYDFDFLIPPIDFYARIIDTYIKTQEFRNKGLSIKTRQDYIKALKRTYTLIEWLGIALIYSKRIWYKGGFIWIWFEAKRLKRKFKKSSK